MFKGGMAGMMKKAQQMQDNMQQVQAEIKTLSATGKAGNGGVEITFSGEHLATNIRIDTALMSDKEMLEDLILTAINDATRQIERISAEKMKNATGGISLPGGLNLPF
jgi:DNA-binding YbaB/EbfC family protein